MTDERRCSGCYDSFSGPWCDNCDQWPCVCVDDESHGESHATAGIVASEGE